MKHFILRFFLFSTNPHIFENPPCLPNKREETAVVRTTEILDATVRMIRSRGNKEFHPNRASRSAK